MFVIDFQLTYARKEWSEERAGWRAVIFLNLVRNVNQIVGHLQNEMADIPYNPDDSQEELNVPRPRALPRLKFSERHRLLQSRLEPLIMVQKSLESNLGAASLDPNSSPTIGAAPFEEREHIGRRPLQEFSINSSNGWKTALDKFRTLRSAPAPRVDSITNGVSPVNVNATTTPAGEARLSEDDVAEIIDSCRDDIKILWDDDIVTETLMRRKVRLEDGPG